MVFSFKRLWWNGNYHTKNQQIVYEKIDADDNNKTVMDINVTVDT